MFIAKSNHDWGALGGLYSSMQDFDRMSDAFYHLGSETLEHQCSVEAQYASLIRLASWQDFTGGGTNDSGGRLNAVSISFSSFSNNNGSALKSSFPKMFVVFIFWQCFWSAALFLTGCFKINRLNGYNVL